MLPDDRGFFLMWRSATDEHHPLMRRHSHYLKLWLWLLGKAAHRGNANEVNPEGLVRTNWSKMARALSYEGNGGQEHNVSPTTAKNICDWFAEEGMIVIEKTTRGPNAEVVLSICNWGKWQNLGRDGRVIDERQPQVTITRDSDEDQVFQIDPDYDTNALYNMWGPIQSRSKSPIQHEAALAQLNARHPNWTFGEVVEIIEKIHREPKLNYMLKRGPAYLVEMTRGGMQVADYAHTFEPFGENGNGTNRQSRVERGFDALDRALGHTTEADNAEGDAGGRLLRLPGIDASPVQRLQLGAD